MLVDNIYCHIEMRDVLRWLSFLHLSCTGGRKLFAALTLDNVLVPAFSAEGPGHRTSEYSGKGPQEFYWGIIRDPNRQESGSHLSILPHCSKTCPTWNTETITSSIWSKDCILMGICCPLCREWALWSRSFVFIFGIRHAYGAVQTHQYILCITNY